MGLRHQFTWNNTGLNSVLSNLYVTVNSEASWHFPPIDSHHWFQHLSSSASDLHQFHGGSAMPARHRQRPPIDQQGPKNKARDPAMTEAAKAPHWLINGDLENSWLQINTPHFSNDCWDVSVSDTLKGGDWMKEYARWKLVGASFFWSFTVWGWNCFDSNVTRASNTYFRAQCCMMEVLLYSILTTARSNKSWPFSITTPFRLKKSVYSAVLQTPKCDIFFCICWYFTVWSFFLHDLAPCLSVCGRLPSYLDPLPLHFLLALQYLSPMEKKHNSQQAHHLPKAVCYLPILLSGEYFITSFKYNFHIEKCLVSRSGLNP